MGFLSGLAKRPFVMILLLVIILIPVIFLLWMGAAYNGLVSRREGAIAQCVEVENQLDRKLTLIPQLLAITVQVNSFEANVLINITRLRSQWLNATTIDQRFNYSQQLDQTILGVRVNNENYPTLNLHLDQPRPLHRGGGDGESDHLCAGAVHPQGSGLQREDPAVPGQHGRRVVRLPAHRGQVRPMRGRSRCESPGSCLPWGRS